MCEFKVYLKEDSNEKGTMITKDIVAAIKKDQNTILMDILGNSQIVENALIEEVSTVRQELILRKIV